MNNEEKWLNDFLTSYPTKEPRKELILKVKQEIRKELPKEEFALPKNFWLYVAMVILMTLPVFSIANYFYYITLKYLISVLFPQLMTLLLVIFVCSVTLMGAICYGAIPIFAALYFGNGKFAK